MGVRVSQVFDETAGMLDGLPVLPMPTDLDAWMNDRRETVDEIWLALPLDQSARIQAIMHQLRHHTVPVRMALDVFPISGLLRYSITDMDGFPMLNLKASPIVGINRFLKALEDRLLAAILLVLTAPLLLLIAMAVRLTSKGPVLFRQKRHGWDGRIIRVYKFRTMVCHEEASGQVTQATRSDERVTPFG